MFELENLFGLVKDGAFSSREEFLGVAKNLNSKDLFSILKDGSFSSVEELESFLKNGGSTPVEKTAINQQETVEEKPVKKKFALDSSSEIGSSVSQESPKQQTTLPELTQEGLKQAMTKKASVPTDMSGKPLFDSKKAEETKTMFKNIEKEKKQLDLEKKKYGDIFDKQLNIKPNVEESKYLKDRLSTINTDLINREEEYVVPELEYQFGDLGFKFEESGATGDWVKVTAPDGKTKIEISLDNFLDSKSKKQSEILQNFIKDNTPAKGLFVLENSMREQDKKFNSQKQVDDSIKVISDELNNLNAKQKQFLAKKSEFDKQLQSLGSNPDEQLIALLEKQRLALKAEMDALIKEEENIKQKGKKLDAAVGKYSISKSKQGTWGGGIWNAFLEGASSVAAGTSSLVVDLATEIAPAGFGMSPKDLKDISGDISKKLGFKGPSESQSIEDWKKTLTEDQLDNWEDEVDDYIKKDLKRKTLPAIRIGNREIFGDADTSKQWSNLKEEGFWGGAILGVSKSLPAMIGGAGPIGAVQRTAAMYAQVSDGLAQEMENNPEFENITENEKLAITLPIGIVGAVLENVGLRNIKSSQGVINNITLRVLGKTNKGVTAKTFRELVENEVDGMISKGLLTITAAGAAEFETGAAQELSETGFKAIYNEIKGKEMFDTPDSISDLIENVVVAGAQEAVGGFVLGVPTAVSTAFTQKGFLKMDDATFDTFANMSNDEKMQSAYIATLKDKITRGELTTAEAKDQLNNYRNSVGLFRQLPDGLSTQQQKEAMNLLKEKRDLENFVEGKDAALVVKQKNRIAEINQSLTKLSQQPSAEYIIDGEQYTREEFINQLEGKTQEELNAMNIVVNNDQATSNIVTEKFKTDAIQEQTTGQVPVQSETTVSETVAEGISEPKSEVVTEQVTQEEVAQPLRDVESTAKALESLPVEERNIPLSPLDLDNEGIITWNQNDSQSVAEAYHRAKEEGSNAELVQAVENSLVPTVEATQPQTIIEEQVSSKTQPEIIETVETEAEGPVQKVTESGTTAFNEGVESVQQTAKEYRDKITEEQRQKQRSYQPGRVNPPALNLFERVSKMMADAYQSIKNEPTKAEVKKAYDALVSETKKQYEFIKEKGLKVIKHEGVGEPYANSQEMLRDIRENNTLKFLPNDVAFGQGDVDVSDNIGLQSSGIKLEDGYELTNSEVFRIVHDYFGHGILGNQFGAIGEENATLQHLDLYSDEAAPAVIFQTRGQNSWVNFSGVNKEANDLRKQARELRKQGKTKEADELVEQANKLFKFAEPKIAIFPTKFNFKRHETARRINEQETIDSRPNKRTNVLSKLLETYSKKSSGTRGVNKKSVRGIKRLGTFDLNVIAEYTLDNKISEGIKKAFPNFKGVQKIYEVTDGDVYRKMMEESLKDNPYAASVTVHSAEKFNGMRMFVTEDGSTGITLTKEGFLGGAFSNPNANRPQNLSQLMVIGIKEGATTAEAFDTILPDYYSNFGFKAVSRTAFNEEFKPMIKNGDAVKDWDFETYKRFNNGRPDVVFFIYDGGNRNTIEDRLGLFDLYQEYEKENTESFDKDGYEQAEEVMKQQAVKRLEFELGIDSEIEVAEENVSQEINEQDLPGYDRMMGEVEGIVQKSKKRRVSEAKIADNVMSYVMGSKVYENATDVQREALVRDVRKRFGLKEKKAPSVARLFGKIKDVKKITMTEKVALKKQIRDLAKGAKDAVRAQKISAQQLSKDIKELSSKGVITAKQAANIISKFSRVNLFNEMSVSNFVDYMAKVFADAEYDNKIKVAKGKLSKARKNIATKIGIADGLILPLKKLFAINPSLIPDSSLERYLELLDIFSASQKVLNLEQRDVVKADVDAILNEINNEQSRADALAEIFNNSDNIVFDNGELDYAASLKNMIKEGDITNEDAEVMRKYKQNIIPQVETSALSEQEIAEKKEEYIKALKQMTVSGDGLPSQDERNLARNLAKLISDTSIENLMKLGVTDLKNLLKVADNINNDYLPHYAQIMVEKINAINNAEVIADSVKKAKPLSFTSLYSKFKAAIMRSQMGGIAEMVRRNPLFYIDQVFGDFKTKDIFDALFAKTAEAEASFKSELKKVRTILENAEAKVAKSFKLNPDKTLMSKFKMMTYMIQLEYESNVGSQQVNPAAEYLNATIKHIDEGKSRFGERDANMLQEILDKYSQDGQIDNEKLFNSFNKAEKDAIKAIRGINESLKDKAQYTAAIIRGDAIDPLNNYVHLNVLHDTEALDVSAATDFLNQANNSRKPSTKAKSLISRTKGAKPLNFDVFTSAQRGAKFVILDYHLTEPIRTARRTMNQATANLEADGRIPKQQREIKNAIDGAFEEAVTDLLTNSILQNSLADEAIDFISKQGYRAVLAGTGRFAAELISNITFAVLADPKAFTSGVKYKGIIMSTDAPRIMENVKSKQTNRIFPSDTLSGKFIDTSILSQASGIQSASSKNPVFNKMQQIWNLTGKKYQNVVELTADTLISTPDKLVMRPMWFGSFANEFKKITGVDVDFEKIASNDQAYMDANKDAIEQSKNEADNKSVMTGATDNSFMGILKGTVKPSQSLSTRAFNNFNNYMTRFLIFEYVTARTAIYAMVGNGTLSKKQGAAMLGAVATRMTVYSLLSQMLANGIMGLFGIGEEEEEDEKSLKQKIGQSLASTFTSLLLGRDFGNATKLVINYGVEEVNEKFLDFLREGDYDPYKDGIAYSIIPRDGKDDELGKLLINMGGSFGPALNTASLIYKNRKGIPAVLSGGTTKKELDAIEREERVVKERIPLEVLGHFGLIPLYKDVRKAVNKSIYSSIKEAERAAAQRKREAEDLLGGYDNKTDLERYNPRLYEKNFGKGSEWYESTKEEREAKLKEAKEEREMKDRIYNYTEKDGFGSKKFGEKKSSKKGKGGFGSKKFGAD